MSAIVSGLIGGAIAAALAVLAWRTQKGARYDSEGWKQLRPGWLMHFAVFLSVAAVAALTAFFIAGGSTRADADEQDLWALLLLVAFAAAGIWLAWFTYLRRVEWKGDLIRIRSIGSTEFSFRFDDVTEIRSNCDGSQAKLLLKGGRVVRVDVYSHGFKELMEHLEANI